MTTDEARAALATVIDPEVGLDIVEMGLVYWVEIPADESGQVNVTMTLTTPGCPLHDVLVDGVERALLGAGATLPVVDVVWDPPWSPDRIGQGGLDALGAPPHAA